MSLRFAKIVSLAAIAGAAGFSLWARGRLPDAAIATHFDAAGRANGYMPRDTALAFMPVMSLALWAVMLWILPAIMPKKGRLERSSEAYGASVVVILLFLSVVHIGVIALALHFPVDLKRVILFGTGLLFVVLGNYLPKTRYNYVMGIRSPWTLASEEVWDKTHRFSGPLFMLLGAFVIGDAALVAFPLAFMLMVPAALAVSVVCVAYSYIVAKRLNLA